MANRRHSPPYIWRFRVVAVAGDGEDLLLLDGRFGCAAAPGLEKAVRALLDRGATRIVLDFSQVDYASSAALRVVEGLSAELQARGGRLALRHLSDPVRLVLELSGLADRIQDV